MRARTRAIVIGTAIVALSLFHIFMIRALPSYTRITLTLLSGVLVFVVQFRLLKGLLRAVQVHRLSMLLGLAHLLFISDFATVVYYSCAIDASSFMMWTIPAAMDLPISLLGVPMLLLLGSLSPPTGIEIWGPAAFFGIFGSFQYYLVGRLLEVRSDARPEATRTEGKTFPVAGCMLAMLVVQVNVTFIYLAPLVPHWFPRPAEGLVALFLAGFSGMVLFSVLQPRLSWVQSWLVSFLPVGVLIGLLRLLSPNGSLLARYGLPHLPLSLVGAALGGISARSFAKRLVEGGVRIKDGVRFGVLLVVLSVLTCYLYAVLTYVLV